MLEFVRLYELGTAAHYCQLHGTTPEAARRLFHRLTKAGTLTKYELGFNARAYYCDSERPDPPPQRLPIAFAILAYCAGTRHPRLARKSAYPWLWQHSDYCLIDGSPCLLIVDQGSELKHLSRKLWTLCERMNPSEQWREAAQRGEFQARIITAGRFKAQRLSDYLAGCKLPFHAQAALVEEYSPLVLRRMQ